MLEDKEELISLQKIVERQINEMIIWCIFTGAFLYGLGSHFLPINTLSISLLVSCVTVFSFVSIIRLHRYNTKLPNVKRESIFFKKKAPQIGIWEFFKQFPTDHMYITLSIIGLALVWFYYPEKFSSIQEDFKTYPVIGVLFSVLFKIYILIPLLILVEYLPHINNKLVYYSGGIVMIILFPFLFSAFILGLITILIGPITEIPLLIYTKNLSYIIKWSADKTNILALIIIPSLILTLIKMNIKKDIKSLLGSDSM